MKGKGEEPVQWARLKVQAGKLLRSKVPKESGEAVPSHRDVRTHLFQN